MSDIKTIELPHGITLTHDKRYGPKGATAITCSEMEVCEGCESAFCQFDCDLSQMTEESEEDMRERIETNCRIEGVLSLIQNLYSMGFDHVIEEMGPAIESTFEDIANRT